jgi:hypothetical protein
MAKLRVFISSTFYDLRHIRSSIEGFVERMGYEPTLSEKGKIAYDPDIPLDESCYREASYSDIFVLIIGGRYGSAASEENATGSAQFYDRYESVTKKEYESATRREIPVYILVEKQVMFEFETYKKNRTNKTIEYAHVDSINIFRFLDGIFKKSKNNPVYQFDHYTEIETWLKEQWSGYFRELINRKSENKQLHSLNDKVSELSSINTSLQRYLEEVVSSVSTPEKAEALIKDEHTKLLEEKNLRSFKNITLVSELLNEDRASLNYVIDVFSSAESLDDLATNLESGVEDFSFELAIQHWKKSPRIVDDINFSRKLLGKSHLTFEA